MRRSSMCTRPYHSASRSTRTSMRRANTISTPSASSSRASRSTSRCHKSPSMPRTARCPAIFAFTSGSATRNSARRPGAVRRMPSSASASTPATTITPHRAIRAALAQQSALASERLPDRQVERHRLRRIGIGPPVGLEVAEPIEPHADVGANRPDRRLVAQPGHRRRRAARRGRCASCGSPVGAATSPASRKPAASSQSAGTGAPRARAARAAS